MENNYVKEVNACSSKIRLHRGDIILANLNDKNGSAQRGIRPVLIVCNEKALKYGRVANVLPITTKIKLLPVHVAIEEGVLKCDSQILVEQIITIDIELQYIKYLGKVSNDTMMKVQQAISVQLGFSS